MPKITLQEIAKKAGVAKSTASKILNNRQFDVDPETRENIVKIAREFNYRPNYFARSLKTGKTNCIGLLGSLSIVDVSSICFTAVTAGIEQNMEETKSKYSLVMFGANFQETPEKSLELIERRMVDGLILIILAPDIQKFNHQLMPQLKKLNIPFVVVHSTSQELPYNNVGLDSRQAGYDAAEHLIKAGHQRISFYMRDWHNPQLTEILGGFKKAVVDRGRAWSDKQIIEPVVDPGSDMYLAARKTIAQLLPLPRALFFPDDASAYAALAACEERGVRVPQDLAIMGCDDETIPYLTTRLTTIHHPFKEKGHEAVTMLTQILDGVLDPEAIHRKILRPYVVVRETCGGRNS